MSFSSEAGSSVGSPHQGSLHSTMSICSCENQLAYWDWNSVPHPNLPERCKRTLDIGGQPQGIDNIAGKDGKTTIF